MTVIIGYFLCLAVIMPAFSLDVFFALLGATTRQHDLLALFRATSQMLATVTSPVKIGLTIIILFGTFAVDSARSTRGMALIVASVVGLVSMLQVFILSRAVGAGAAIIILPSAAASLVTFSWGTRLLANTATC